MPSSLFSYEEGDACQAYEEEDTCLNRYYAQLLGVSLSFSFSLSHTRARARPGYTRPSLYRY